MNLITEAKYALKFTIDLHLATPLLLRSGLTGDFTDSAIERTPKLNEKESAKIHINGYVWASLLRRALARIDKSKAEELGSYHRGKDGKIQKNEKGVSPLWCEATIADLHATSVNPGVAIDRQWGAAKGGALYNDELVIAGLPLSLSFTLLAKSEGDAKAWQSALLDVLKLIDDGIENIGGGWTYGYGRLKLDTVKTVTLDLKTPAGRAALWQPEPLGMEPQALPATVAAMIPATVITVRAQVAPGQLLAIKSSVFPVDAQKFGKLPDSFVFRRNRMIEEKIKQEPVIPGKAIRQALLSMPLERKWRSTRKEGEPEICLTTTHGKQRPEDKRCECRRCRWFGSTDAAGIIAVTDAPVENPTFEVVSRVQLCEHSMQNMNLFSGEYLTGGTFSFRILIDGARSSNAKTLVGEVRELLNEMKGKTAPPGWYRLGGTATCTGQVQVIDYSVTGAISHER